ncbi:hypothetical protein D1872_256780 [compost metagenome]
MVELRIGAPHRQARDAHGQIRAAVQALLQRDKPFPPGMQTGEQQRAFVGLRAAVHKERPGEPSRQHARQPLRQVHVRLRQINRARMLKGLQLLRGPPGDFRIAVTAGDHGDAREEIRIARAVMPVQILHLAFDQLRRIPVKVAGTRIEILPPLLQHTLRSDISLLHLQPPSFLWFR